MGIYRTLLEEEVPHLDDNNNPDEQIKELQDVIDDHDANEAEQVAAQDAAFGPDCGVDDIMDESAMAIYEFECGHSAIMQAIGMHELQEAASGREFIMEAADIKGFFKSIKDKIVAFFKKVWSVLQRWAGNFTALITTNKKFYDKYKSQLNDGYNIATKDTARKKPEGYEFKLNELNSAMDTKGLFKNYAQVSTIRKAIESGNANILNNAMSAEDVESGLNKVRGKLAGGDGEVSASEFTKALKDKLYGGDKHPMWMSVDAIKEALNNDYKKNTNEMMKNSKEQFKAVLDELNSLEKAASHMEDGATRNKIMAVCTRYSTFVRGALTATQTWRTARLSALRAYAVQGRKYAMIYVAASNKGKHKGFQKESTEYGFLGNLGLV